MRKISAQQTMTGGRLALVPDLFLQFAIHFTKALLAGTRQLASQSLDILRIFHSCSTNYFNNHN